MSAIEHAAAMVPTHAASGMVERFCRTSARWLYVLFLLSLVLDIGGAFGLKYAVGTLIGLLLVLCPGALWVPRSFLWREGVLFVLLPAGFLGLAVVVLDVPPGLAGGSLTYLAVWMIFPLLLQLPRKWLVEAFVTVMVGASLVVLVLAGVLVAAFVWGRLDLVLIVHEFSATYRLGYLGQRPDSMAWTFLPNVYFRWMMLLIPAAVLVVGRPLYQAIPVLLAVLVSLSTGLVLFAGLGLVAALALAPDTGPRKRHAVRLKYAGIAAAMVLIMVVSGLSEARFMVTGKLSTASPSTSVKMGHIASIQDILVARPAVALVGMGVGSEFYSRGAQAVVADVEVSHFNMVRQYGLLYTLLVFAYVAFIAVRLWSSDLIGKRWAIGLLALFGAAGTNPLLLSPVFFTVLVIGAAYVAPYRQELPGV
jgi:hypothetical protein